MVTCGGRHIKNGMRPFLVILEIVVSEIYHATAPLESGFASLTGYKWSVSLASGEPLPVLRHIPLIYLFNCLKTDDNQSVLLLERLISATRLVIK